MLYADRGARRLGLAGVTSPWATAAKDASKRRVDMVSSDAVCRAMLSALCRRFVKYSNARDSEHGADTAILRIDYLAPYKDTRTLARYGIAAFGDDSTTRETTQRLRAQE